jgi:DNA modification methylase
VIKGGEILRAPYYTDDQVTLHHGDALDVARRLKARSVDCIVTSPPYFGLRDYGIDGQYGLEESPAEYVATMRALFSELRRVLADDGTLWLNIGDSYASKMKGQGGGGGKSTLGDSADGSVQMTERGRELAVTRQQFSPRQFNCDVAAKNLLGIPWRVAFALQDDGWILRNDIVWNKGARGLPESVKDRLTARHEYVFLFAKSRRYWFDLDPIREDYAPGDRYNYTFGSEQPTYLAQVKPGAGGRDGGQIAQNPKGRHPGDVWEIATQPFPEAHFAVMPERLARKCILGGCTPRRCQECGHVPEPVKERGGLDMSRPQARRALEIAEANGLTDKHFVAIRSAGATDAGKAAITQSGTGKNTAEVAALAAHAKSVLKGYYREFLLDREVTTGWSDCGHNAYRAGVVLDPFSGSGTTGLAAQRTGRHYIGVDLNSEYLDLSLNTRLRQSAINFNEESA